MERKHQIIESLLLKPTKKPDFSAFKGSEILKKAQQFIPVFIQTTDRLLSDPELLKTHQMDIKVVDKNAAIEATEESKHEEDHEMSQQEEETENRLIQMVSYLAW